MTTPLAPAATTLSWMVIVRGALAIVFGIIAFIAPAAALFGLVFVFAAYVVVDGIMMIAHAVRVRSRERRWGWLLAQGVVAVLAGIVAAIFPAAAGLVGGLIALWTIAAFALLAGASGIPAAAGLASGTGRKGWALASAVLTLLFGVLLAVLIVVSPGATVLSLVWLIGAYAIAFGVGLIVVGAQLRKAA